MVSHWFWQRIGVESLAASAAHLSAGGFGECLQLQLCPHMRANQECGGALQSPWQTSRQGWKRAEMEAVEDGKIFFFSESELKGKGKRRQGPDACSVRLLTACVLACNHHPLQAS